MNDKILDLYDKFMPLWIKNIVHHHRWKIKQNFREINIKLSFLRSSGRPVKILFIISNLPMWRAQNLYDFLKNDSRFDPKIIISPFQRYNEEERKQNIDQITKYLNDRGINDYKIADFDFNLEKFLIEDYNPDIIFPSQFYDNIYGNKLDIKWNKNRIYCHLPYGLITVKHQLAYNYKFHNTCWKFYIPSVLHYKTAKRMMANKAKNVVVVGEPNYDKFTNSEIDPWKKSTDGRIRKRIIWAPHFSINPNDALHRASFLWLFQDMINLACEYKDKIQIVFKPHPHLHNALCKLEGWGQKKTDEYYHKWDSMENTQLEEGDYIGIFKYSDAMIHDCGSFTGEYMYVNKPVMFTTKDIETLRKEADDFGLKCIDLHYIGSNINEVRRFIEDIVLDEDDPLEPERTKLYSEYLLPPNGQSVAENIYQDLIKSFGFKPNRN